MNYSKRGTIDKDKNQFELLSDYPQTKHVVMEELAVLGDLKEIRTPKETAPDGKEQHSTKSSSSTSDGDSSNSLTSSTSAQDTAMKTMARKLEENAPYNVFFTAISDLPQTITQKNAVTFTDLLCPSLGELKCSLQINFIVDSEWLMEQYKKSGQGEKPLTILHGAYGDTNNYVKLKLPHVTEHYVKVDGFGSHHSKLGIYVYSDNSLRVVVSTANLYYEDWNIFNNGLWVSPRCPVLPSDTPDTAGESLTNFKAALVSYLKEYNVPVLKQWIDFVKRSDFGDVKVFLITSMPGQHTAMDRPSHSHLHNMGALLSTHCSLPAKTTLSSDVRLSWGIIAQSSSLGVMGKAPAEWLHGNILRSLASHQDCRLPANSNTTISIVYPTKDNVLDSYYGPEGSGCLSYREDVHEEQKWFRNYLHHWKADDLNRSRALPHIKTYCRVSPCMTQLAWFLITSANISRCAWGSRTNKAGISYIRSYEVGVLFLPKYFDETYFRIKDDGSGKNTPLFPLIYDLPLTSYKKGDEPWCT